MIGGSEQGLEISSVSSTKAYCYIPGEFKFYTEK